MIGKRANEGAEKKNENIQTEAEKCFRRGSDILTDVGPPAGETD